MCLQNETFMHLGTHFICSQISLSFKKEHNTSLKDIYNDFFAENQWKYSRAYNKTENFIFENHVVQLNRRKVQEKLNFTIQCFFSFSEKSKPLIKSAKFWKFLGPYFS